MAAKEEKYNMRHSALGTWSCRPGLRRSSAAQHHAEGRNRDEGLCRARYQRGEGVHGRLIDELASRHEAEVPAGQQARSRPRRGQPGRGPHVESRQRFPTGSHLLPRVPGWWLLSAGRFGERSQAAAQEQARATECEMEGYPHVLSHGALAAPGMPVFAEALPG